MNIITASIGGRLPLLPSERCKAASSAGRNILKSIRALSFSSGSPAGESATYRASRSKSHVAQPHAPPSLSAMESKSQPQIHRVVQGVQRRDVLQPDAQLRQEPDTGSRRSSNNRSLSKRWPCRFVGSDERSVSTATMTPEPMGISGRLGRCGLQRPLLLDRDQGSRLR